MLNPFIYCGHQPSNTLRAVYNKKKIKTKLETTNKTKKKKKISNHYKQIIVKIVSDIYRCIGFFFGDEESKVEKKIQPENIKTDLMELLPLLKLCCVELIKSKSFEVN